MQTFQPDSTDIPPKHVMNTTDKRAAQWTQSRFLLEACKNVSWDLKCLTVLATEACLHAFVEPTSLFGWQNIIIWSAGKNLATLIILKQFFGSMGPTVALWLPEGFHLLSG